MFLWALERNESAKQFYQKHGLIATNCKELEPGTPEYKIKFQKAI